MNLHLFVIPFALLLGCSHSQKNMKSRSYASEGSKVLSPHSLEIDESIDATLAEKARRTFKRKFTLFLKHEGQSFLQAQVKTDTLSFSSLKEYLKLAIAMAEKQGLLIQTNDSHIREIKSGHQSEFFKNNQQLDRLKKLFKISYNSWHNSPGDVAFLGNEKVSFEPRNKQLVLLIDSEVVLHVAMPTKKAESNATFLNDMISKKSPSEVIVFNFSRYLDFEDKYDMKNTLDIRSRESFQ